MSLIETENLTKVYHMGAVEVHALRGVTFNIEEGEWVAIMGPSGSGKSTLMHIISCLDTPTTGAYHLNGVDVSQMNDNQLAVIRGREIGFVFQSFNLLQRAPAFKQVMLPLQYSRDGSRVEPAERKRRAMEALERVGLGDRMSHRPSELSGGQQQRVAIARALANDPPILIGDEITGDLDSITGFEVMNIITKLNQDTGMTIVYVTHDPRMSKYCTRLIRIQDGKILSDEANEQVRITDAESVVTISAEGDK